MATVSETTMEEFLELSFCFWRK